MYDESGNIARIYENEALIIRYTYDQLNRLIREDNKPLNKTYLIAYDNNGNILSKESFSYSLGKREELQTTVPTLWLYDGDRLISNGNGSNGYDSGNPTTYQGKSVTWSKGRQMTAFGSTSFAYDGSGKRYQKGSLYFTYGSDGKLLCQSNGMEFIYDHEGAVGFKYNGNLYAYRKNAQGDVIEILDSTGSVVVKYTYNAWGEHKVYDNTGAENTTSDFIGNLNPIRYRSYYYDVETQLYYLNTRYYDPAVGRFINADDISYLDPETINGLNLYAYCVNNPVMLVDPNGNKWIELILTGIVVVLFFAAGVFLTVGSFGLLGAVVGGAALGFAFGAINNFVSQVNNNGWNNIDVGNIWKAGGIGAAIGAVSGLFSYGASVIGASIGQQLGFSLGFLNIGGTQVSWVFNMTTMMAVSRVVGKVVGNIVGAALGDYLGNRYLNQIWNFDLKDTIGGEILGWLGDIIKWLKEVM